MAGNAFWNDDWMDIQKKYWEQLSEMNRQAMGLSKPPKNPWEQGMEHWWNAVKGAVPPVGQDFYEKMMDQGRGFFEMAENVMKSTGAYENANDVWSSLLDSFTDSFSQAFPGGDMAPRNGFWEMPLDNWNRMVSVLSPVPGDILRGMPTGGVKEHLDRILGAPGLGYTRESQAQYQSLMQAVLEYQEALAGYAMLFTRMGEKSVAALQDKMQDTPVESARQLYDTWIGCCEEVYAEQVMTPEYVELHGRLVNALMLVKCRWGGILNEFLSMYNVPTRDDLRTLQVRMQEQRRENKTLRTEVAKLRKVVEQLGKTTATAPADSRPSQGEKSVVSRKKASRKKSVAKKVAKKNVVRKKSVAAIK